MGKGKPQPCPPVSPAAAAAAVWFPLVALSSMMMTQPTPQRTKAVRKTCSKRVPGSCLSAESAGVEVEDDSALQLAAPMVLPRPQASSSARSESSAVTDDGAESQTTTAAQTDLLEPACSARLSDFLPWSSFPTLPRL